MTSYSQGNLIVAGAVVALGVGVGAVFWAPIALLIPFGIFACACYFYLRSVPMVVLVLCGLVSVPTIVQVGPASGLAVLTILYVSLAGLTWLLSNPASSPLPMAAIPYSTFLIWAFISTSANARFNINAVQNLLVLSIPLLMILLMSSQSLRLGTLSIPLQATWSITAAFSILVFVIVEFGLRSFVYVDAGARSFALFAMFCVPWHAASWRYGSRSSMWIYAALVLGIGVSLSRTALIVSILILALSRFNPTKARDWATTTCWLVIGSVSAYLAISKIDPLRERFFEGDTSLQIGGLSINATGRTWMWETTLESYQHSIWVGQGSASVQELMSSLSTNISHPHNDYLRILHDFGAIGLILWITAISTFMYHSVRSWIKAETSGVAKVHLATTLAIVGLSLSMLTDNPIVYVFCMVPLGIGIGSSLALEMHESASYHVAEGRGAISSNLAPSETRRSLPA